MECCTHCKGSAPYFICRIGRGCGCHAWGDVLSQKTPTPQAHRDPTYFAAMRNIRRNNA